MSSSDILHALRRALESDPRNGTLWLHYAEVARGCGEPDEELRGLRTAAELEETRLAATKRLVPLLRERGELAEALIRAESVLERHEDDELAAELERVAAMRPGGAPADDSLDEGDEGGEGRRTAAAAVQPEGLPPDAWADQFDWGDLRVTFDDVAGLDDVKRQIRLKIIAPFQKPEIYRAFGREGGGGLLLYGPPGCGKTYVARATAGELSARFVSVSIHDVVNHYWGESEKLVHALFEDARRNSPTVLFFDEFDALGSTRGRVESQFWKTLVDQLLQEMDGMVGRNTDVLLFAATNMPWNVDAAFRRPGRFDRVLFVPPPDDAARRAMIERQLAKLPGGGGVAPERIVRETRLFTGADLKALCERAAEGALERSLDSGELHEVTSDDFERALGASQSTAREWMSTARNYARYSNDGGQYDELVGYLKEAGLW